ncbi:hypothetical protein EV383_4455 [Pseudonocardia sediminis]|uniref:Uncharacterized protein n=1 Tax=Pseudonocardia sediminis TaxID=1397368 RepID=A0A4V2FR83_PSEST|nr:hypothetical protein [Pseudonocardia sediminis]RZT87530.1 hypothetical protein EV383_4455 [Pseudonocardia sediminis]
MIRRRLAPIPPLHEASPRSGAAMWEACCAGREPAESLHWRDREDLFVRLTQAGWSVEAVAEHTRTTVYTVDRILDRPRMALEDRVRASFRAGLPVEQVAVLFDVPVGEVRRLVHAPLRVAS